MEVNVYLCPGTGVVLVTRKQNVVLLILLIGQKNPSLSEINTYLQFSK